MSAHTPGPWEIEEDDCILYIGDGEELIASVDLDAWPDISRANARLIAAAPELLEATRESLNVLARVHEDGGCPACEEEYQHNCPVLLGLEAAIAKAEGR